uniref:Ig-like domain-containing protein n=1 Tax=Schistosoma mansoni TaxID=6183 RepID=A0A3Q0KU63_SCHMA
MMRYTLSSDHLMLVYLVVSLTLKFFNCQHVCDENYSLKEGKLVFQDDSHAYSQHYHYSQIIRVNRPSPSVNCKSEKFVGSQKINPKFPFKVFGSDVSRFDIDKYGIRFMNGSKELGSIDNHSPYVIFPQYEISNEENLLAIRFSFQIYGDSLNRIFMTTTVMLPNGNIYVYYDNITEELDFESLLSGSIECDGEGERDFEISVDAKWIKSGTLVEYKVSGDCPKYNTTKTCQDSKTLNTKCTWHEKANMCIVSTDMDIDDFKVNSCQIENSSNVNVSTTPIVVEQATTTQRTSESELRNELERTDQQSESHLNSSNVNVSTTPIVVKQATTTPGISESELRNELERTDQQSESHLNMTKEPTEDNGHKKSNHSLHIVIPVVICFLVVCSGFIICLWLCKKKKRMP